MTDLQETGNSAVQEETVKKKTSMTRSEARENLFRVIFQGDFHIDEDIEEILSSYEAENEDVVFDKRSLSYVKESIAGIYEHLKDIDEKISLYSRWNIDRLSKVDKAILRVAVYEILYNGNVPDSVAANEAVNLAKKYSDDRSRSFVNGIISKVIENK